MILELRPNIEPMCSTLKMYKGKIDCKAFDIFFEDCPFLLDMIILCKFIKLVYKKLWKMNYFWNL